MLWRKWLVRGLVYSVLGGGALAFLLYNFWTSPATVRRQVLAKLAQRFPGATVTLDAAHLRLFGGIAVGELRMARRDDLDKADFLYVPSAVIYHDKEQLLGGILALRKIELFRPRLRIVRERDGRLNFEGIMAPSGDERDPLPTIVLQQATIIFEDRSAAPGVPLLEIKDVNLTVVNDPLPVLTVEGSGLADVLGPVHLSGRYRRDTREANLEFELTSIPVGPALVQRLAAICPEAAAHLRQFRAEGDVRAKIDYRPGASPALTFDATIKLHKGELSHARLPLPLDDLEAELRLVNAAEPTPAAHAAPAVSAVIYEPELLRVSSAHLSARSGKMLFDLALKDLCVPYLVTSAGAGEELQFEKLMRELTWEVKHLPVTKELLAYFKEMKEIQHDYSPNGEATVSHHFLRDAVGGWHKSWHVEPEGMSGEFYNFRYPAENLTGTIDYHKDSNRNQDCDVKLSCTAAGRPIRLTGHTHNEGEGPARVEMEITGSNFPLDDKLDRALQGPSRTVINEFHPHGLADFNVKIYRALGATLFANRFLIAVHDTAFNYDLFPYQLENVSGVLDILPDHWEARDFHGTHGKGEMRFSGRSFGPTLEQGPKPLMRVEIHGTSIPLDDQFEAALAPAKMPARAALKYAWQTLNLSGQMSFDAAVIDMGGGDPANLDVKVTARGCSMRPKFFDYALSDMGGTVHYTRERITFNDIEAKHGTAALRVRSGQILTKPSGGFQTRLGVPDKPGTGLVLTGLTADADLLAALPDQVRKGMDAVKLRGPFDLTAELIVDPQEDGKNDIWWDGTLVVRNATLDAGVEVTGVQGQASCCGVYKDQKLRAAVGNVWFTEASLVGQPLHHLHTRFVVDKDSPDLLRFYDVGAELFGGQIGGQAHIDFTNVPRFELNLIGLQVKLEQFGRFNKFGSGAELEGMAELSLFLKGRVDDPSSLSGDGRLDVPKGKLYRLPPLLDLLKALGLRAPDRTAFERGRLEFSVEGQTVKVSVLNLYGSAVSLRGQGTVKIDGSDLNLDFNADPGMFPPLVPILGSIEQTVSDQLLRIKVRGSLTDPKFEKELMPGILDPVRHLLGTSK